MKENLKLREDTFRKMGWVVWGHGRNSKMIKAELWKDPSGNNMGADLPPIESQWEVTAKYLVPFMRERGWDYGIGMWPHTDSDIKCFSWETETEDHIKYIKDDNIALAACQAFMKTVDKLTTLKEDR